MNDRYRWFFIFLCCLKCDVQNLTAFASDEHLLPNDHPVTIYGAQASTPSPSYDHLLIEIKAGPAEMEMNKIIHYLKYQEDEKSRKGFARHYKKEKGITAESLHGFLLKQALDATLPNSPLSRYLADLYDTALGLQQAVKELIKDKARLESSFSEKMAASLNGSSELDGSRAIDESVNRWDKKSFCAGFGCAAASALGLYIAFCLAAQ